MVDSGAVECVVPHFKVEETPESSLRGTWTCAGGKDIEREGKVTVL